MLVLSRKRGTRVIIRTPEGREIVVTAVETRGDSVRLGFEMDDDVAVNREEIQQRIDADYNAKESTL